MNILVSICGRGGSKGIPGKNIKAINGKPLIAYTIETALSFTKINNADLGLSTDDAQIKSVAADFGLYTTYTRPESLATDSAGKIPVIRDLMDYEEKKRQKTYDYVLDLDITSPLRNIEDLVAAFKIIEADEQALNLFSVNPCNRNPYFNMVEKCENGYYCLVKDATFTTRQSAAVVYDLNASFYFFRRAFFSESTKTISPRSLIYVMPHICFDLDHPLDFEFMEYLMVNKKLDFLQ